MASLAQASQASDVFAEHQPSGSTPAPSAPPLYPQVQQPSAPPLSADGQLVVGLLSLLTQGVFNYCFEIKTVDLAG